MTKCPKCGSENTYSCGAQHACLACMSTWTDWQQSLIEQQREEIERLKTMSTIEMMCENESVRAHVTEWENRCLKAEAELSRLYGLLEEIEGIRPEYLGSCHRNWEGAFKKAQKIATKALEGK
jgi:hypothetical protein